MKRITIIATVFTCLAFTFIPFVRAQTGHSVGTSRSDRAVDMPAENSIYLELGGNALLYSINYDRLLTEDLSLRVGFGYLGLGVGGTVTNADGSTSDGSVSASIMMVPVMANYLISSHSGGEVGSSKLELGAGILYAHFEGDALGTTGSFSGIGGAATIGYRYQPADGGFLFRIGLTPTIAASHVFPWAGLSVGFTFK